MSFIDDAARSINFKIVYHGPGLVGKTTSLQHIYDRTDPSTKGKWTSVVTEFDRTLFFHCAPPGLAPLRGLGVTFHLYTVPGPVFYDDARKLVLKGADGVIFMADSQEGRRDANIESLEGLRNNLEVNGLLLEELPLVLMYNKRDLPEIMSVAEMDAELNPENLPRFEGVARTGQGVFEAFKACVKQILVSARAQGNA